MPTEATQKAIKASIELLHEVTTDFSAAAYDTVASVYLDFVAEDFTKTIETGGEPVRGASVSLALLWKALQLTGMQGGKWTLKYEDFGGTEEEPVVTYHHILWSMEGVPVFQELQRMTFGRINGKFRALRAESSTPGEPLRLNHAPQAVYSHPSAALRVFVIDPANVHQLQKVRPLSEGHYGVVFEGRFDGEPVAIKELKYQDTASSMAAPEWALLCSAARHPNICCCVAVTGRTLVLELMDFSLEHLLMVRGILHPARNTAILHAVVLAMAHLHKHHVLHLDLAARNVLIRLQPFSVKLSDFGLARTPNNMVEEREGPIRWTSPERLFQHLLSPAADVWAFGMLIIELHTCRVPFAGLSTETVVRMLRYGQQPDRPVLPAWLDEVLDDVLEDHLDRPSFAELSPIFQSHLTPLGDDDWEYADADTLHSSDGYDYYNYTFASTEQDMYYGDLGELYPPGRGLSRDK